MGMIVISVLFLFFGVCVGVALVSLLSVSHEDEPLNVVPGMRPEIESYIEDDVNHPIHYESDKYSCIDIMIETQGIEAVRAFCICNALKCIYRHRNKGGMGDIKKARWYIDKYIELCDN